MAAAPVLIDAATTRDGYLASRWDRLNGPSRIAGIDLARGFAVLGMFAAHLLWIDPFSITDVATWGGIVHGRSSIVFATLAGVSIGLVAGGTTPPTASGLRTQRLRLGVRAVVLWILGVALVATGVPVYVILPAYGILFLLAIPLIALRARTLLLLAGGLAIVMPFVQVVLDDLPLWSTASGYDLALAIGWHYPFPVWSAFLVVGIAVARLGITRGVIQWRMLAVGVALSVTGYGLHAASGADEAAEQESFWGALWTAREHSSGLLEVVGSGGFALAFIAACLLLCRTAVTWVVLPLRAVGAMPLTSYTAQLVVWIIWAGVALNAVDDLVGFRDLQPFLPITLATVIGCTAWALLVGRGPFEWALAGLARLVPDPGCPLPADGRRR